MLYKPSFAWYIYSYSANGCIFASSLVCACIQFRSAEIFSVRRDTEGSEILIYFNCDYTEGCHPNILKRLCETNMMQTVGYGEDEICDLARAKIRKACGREDVDVHFLVGGTQTNATVIAAILRPHQGALSADTGHINVHETGAIENSGHKVLTVPNTDGKIAAAQVEELCRAHYADASFEHTVQPGMVYISNPTEFGTVYTRSELEALHAVCKARHLPLFIDGARLGAALYSPVCDYTLADMAHMCEVFTIGGTKMGLLFGEAAVFSAPELAKDFRYFIKQNGGMLAKGRLLGVQFAAALEQDLWLDMGRHANTQAQRIAAALSNLGVPMLVPSPTNQIFPILPDDQIAQLQERVLPVECNLADLEQLKEKLFSTARDIDSYQGPIYNGRGTYAGKIGKLVDAGAALDSGEVPPVSDQPTITPATGQNDTFTLGASERKTLQYTLAGYTEWRLDDPSGKIAKSIDGNVVTLTIDASQYAAGSYTAELLAVNGTKTAKRTIAYTVSEGDNPTGISMDFYPNPCTDVLNILPNYSGESTIRIRNSMGTEVMNITLGLINEEPVKLDVSGLASGTYLVQVTYNGIQITRTIVKR